MPVVIEMNENATAKDSKWRSDRTNCCLYPKRGSRASSSCWARVVTFCISSSGGGQGLRLRDLGRQQRDVLGGQCRAGVGILDIVSDDGGQLVQLAHPAHGDDAELAGVGKDIVLRGMRDDRAPDDDLGRVVVGEPRLVVHAARAEERPVGVELGEEAISVSAGARSVARPDLAPA